MRLALWQVKVWNGSKLQKKAGPPVMAGLFVGWGVCLVDVEWFGRDDFTVDLDQGDHVAGLGQA
ncbi:hypothetical protein, partial [Yoonia sp. R2-816]|uniref:hypothetical protein n=1 Tax=Yoonia sp. R2-816 TaxID=3342638 RepID=UPI00372ACEAE